MSDMASFNVGGYHATLTLKSDKKSFKAGEKEITNISGSLKSLSTFLKAGLVGAALKAGQALISFANIASSTDAKTVTLARSLRISSSELAEFRNTALLASTNADGLTSSLLDLQKKSDRLRMGEVDVGLAKSLGMMGIGYQSFLGMDTGTKFRTAMEHAMKMGNKNLAGELLRDVLGNSGKEMFQYLQMSGKSFAEIEERAKALLFTTDESRKKSMEFNIQLKSMEGSFGEIGRRFVSEFGGRLTPIIKDFLDYLIANKNEIIAMIQEVSKLTVGLLRVLQVTGDWAGLIQRAIPTKFFEIVRFSRELLANIFGIKNATNDFLGLLGGIASFGRGIKTIFLDMLLPVKGIIDSIQDFLYYLTPGKYSVLGFALHGGAEGEKKWVDAGKPGIGQKIYNTIPNITNFFNKQEDERRLHDLRSGYSKSEHEEGSPTKGEFYIHIDDPGHNIKDVNGYFGNPDWHLIIDTN
jgi:hypothetical protein